MDAEDFAIVEASVAKMGDGDLVSALDHPGDWRPEAFQLIRDEHARRALTAADAARLRADSADFAIEQEERKLELLVSPLGTFAFFDALGGFPHWFKRADEAEAAGDLARARQLRRDGRRVITTLCLFVLLGAVRLVTSMLRA